MTTATRPKRSKAKAEPIDRFYIEQGCTDAGEYYDSEVFASRQLHEESKRYGRLQGSRLRPMKFKPIESEARFRVVHVDWEPKHDMPVDMKFTDEYWRDYKALRDAFERPTSLISAPSGLVDINMDYSDNDEVFTRAEGWLDVAGTNRRALDQVDKRGLPGAWCVLVELGQHTLTGIVEIQIHEGLHVGTIRHAFVDMIRRVFPTPEELAQYPLTWTAPAKGGAT